MLDIVNSDATQERARNLNALFAGKQIADTYTPGAPRNTVAFTDGTHVTINAATILPGGATAPADNKALAVDADNFTNSDDERYKKHDSGRVVRAWVETTSKFTDTNGMNVPQVTRTITLWVLAERNLRPEKIAEISGEYAAHSDSRPTLLLESSDGTTISAADAALNPQW